jgi:hypothetical protein
MSLKIQKRFLVGLGNWLNDQPLSGRASRARTRFVEDLQVELNHIEADRIKILESVADKDDTGAPKKETDEATGHEKFILSAEAQTNFVQEYSTLMSEEWILDVTDANRDRITEVRNIVLDTDYRFGPQEGDSDAVRQSRIRQMNDYPHWCEAFESMNV